LEIVEGEQKKSRRPMSLNRRESGDGGLAGEAGQYAWSSATSRLKGGCGQDWPPHIS